MLSPIPVAEAPRQEIGESLYNAERRDERKCGGLRGEAELLLAEEWEDASLEPDSCADEGVDQDEKRKLSARARRTISRMAGAS